MGEVVEITLQEILAEIRTIRTMMCTDRYAKPTPAVGNSCPKCGMKLNGVMGYVCYTQDCPIGRGPVSS